MTDGRRQTDLGPDRELGVGIRDEATTISWLRTDNRVAGNLR